MITKTLLIILILLSCSSVYSQYEFDSAQVKKIRLIIEDNKFLTLENDSVKSQNNILKLTNEITVRDCKQRDSINAIIINQKNNQVSDYTETEWHTWVLFGVSLLSTGIVTGLLIK